MHPNTDADRLTHNQINHYLESHMLKPRQTWNTLAVTCTFVALQTLPMTSHALDSASIDYGSGNQTRMVRLGMQWKWESKWWQSNGSHIGGYWDAGLAHWRERRFQNVLDNTQNLTSIGITPVFRFQSDSLIGPYGEFGIGIHYLSDLYDNNGRQLSTRFQFGDRIGAGYVFRNKLDLGLMVEHFSNGGVKQPNSGVNFAVVRLRYHF